MQSTLVVNLNHGLGHQTSPEAQDIQEVTQDHTTQLDRALFTALLRIHNQTAPDNMELQFNGRPIDLFVLYSGVYTLGGITNVQRRDMWAVVIKKMNLDQVGAEMSVDQITKHLKYIYNKYLSQLDLSVASASTEMSAASEFVKSLAYLTPEQQATLNKLPIPTQDLLREATAYLVGLKEQIYISNNLVPVQMPDDRDQFDRDFDLLYMEVQRLSSLLPLYLSVTKEEKVAKAVTMQMDIVEKQRSRLNQQAPSYILNSDLLTRLRQQAAFLYQKITIVCQFVKYRELGEMVIEANLHPQEWEV